MLPNNEIFLKKFAYKFHSLKIAFANCTEDRITHINISVVVNAAEIVIAFQIVLFNQAPN